VTPPYHAITDVPGIAVGHWTDRDHATGCTVVLCPGGAVAGVDQRGAAPGTRETDLLRLGATVQRAHAILLSGGSAYGLDAAGGVMRYLEEMGAGFKVRDIVVPIVPAAILFDLALGDHHVRPDASSGYAACAAATAGAVEQGSVGAGTGATVGKALGMQWAVKGGVGTASLRVGKETIVGALAAVNAYGDVVDAAGRTVAGPRREDGRGFYSTTSLLLEGKGNPPAAGSNTVIAVVACSALLTREEVTHLARQAQNGLARAVRPANTTGDGDTIFSLATGVTREWASLNALGEAAAKVMEEAVLNAVLFATGLAGVPSVAEFLDAPYRAPEDEGEAGGGKGAA
jgi:L-aminopeptidase/D-esterase-like protein